MKLTLILGCFLLVALVSDSEACKCAQRHPQSHFCDTDFTIICKVLKRTVMPNGRDVVYTVSDIQKLRTRNGAYWVLKAAKLYTPLQSATCGVTLEIGKKYILTGRITDKKAQINSCGYVKRLSEVNSYTKSGFKKLYRDGCVCTIEDCLNETDCAATPPDENVCKLNREKFDCYADNTACLPDSNEVCQWQDEPAFDLCIV